MRSGPSRRLTLHTLSSAAVRIELRLTFAEDRSAWPSERAIRSGRSDFCGQLNSFATWRFHGVKSSARLTSETNMIFFTFIQRVLCASQSRDIGEYRFKDSCRTDRDTTTCGSELTRIRSEISVHRETAENASRLRGFPIDCGLGTAPPFRPPSNSLPRIFLHQTIMCLLATWNVCFEY